MQAFIHPLKMNWSCQLFTLTELQLDGVGQVTSGFGKSPVYGPFKIYSSQNKEPQFADYFTRQLKAITKEEGPVEATSELMPVEFMIQPYQLNDFKAKFIGFAENGKQMTKIYGVYEQI